MLERIRRMLKQEEGFTLMELMIVVVIIGILGAIAVPIYNNVQDNAKRAVGEANASMLNRGLQTWVALGWADSELGAPNEVEDYDPTGEESTDEAGLLDFLNLDAVAHVKWDDANDRYKAEPGTNIGTVE